MINIEKRKDPNSLGDYHGGDFCSAAWDALDLRAIGDPRICRAVVGSGSRPDVVWKPLAKQLFDRTLTQISLHTKAGLVVSFDLVLSPPKTFSIAALAGPEISVELINYQDQAVRWVTQEIVNNTALRIDGGYSRIFPSIWKFSHPFNRILEPQLHDHLCVLARFGINGRMRSLDARPLYALKSAFEAIYHYGLVSQLTAGGYGIEFTGPGIKSWEIAGVDPALIDVFSKRSRGAFRDSEGLTERERSARKRSAMVSERKKHPKLPMASLGEARNVWAEKIGNRRVLPRCSAVAQVPTGLDRSVAEQVFSDDPVLTRTEILAEVFRVASRTGVQFRKLAAAVDQALKTGVSLGGLATAERRVYCHLGQLDRQRFVWDSVRRGRGTVSPSVLSTTEKATRWIDFGRLESAVSSTDRIRIVPVNSFVDPLTSQEDNTLLKQADFEVSKDAKLVWEKRWSVDRLLAHIAMLEKNEKLVVVVPKSQTSRRFFGQLLRLGPPPTKEDFDNRRNFKMGRLTISVRSGRVASGSQALLQALRTTRKEHPLVLRPPEMSSEACVKMTHELLLHLNQSGNQKLISLVVDEVIPWPKTSNDWTKIDLPLWLCALHNIRGLARHGHRWSIKNVSDETIIMERGRAQKMISLAHLLNQPTGAVLVREFAFQIPAGSSCEASVDFRRKEGKLKKGDLVFPVGVTEDGSVLTSNGGHFSPGFRLFFPVLTMDCRVPSGRTLIVEASLGDTGWHKALNTLSRGALVILSPEPDVVSHDIASFVAASLARKKAECEDTGPGTPPPKMRFLPPASFWLAFLERWRQRKSKATGKEKMDVSTLTDRDSNSREGRSVLRRKSSKTKAEFELGGL